MQRVESRLELAPEAQASQRSQLLSLAGQLFQPDLSAALRIQIATQMCGLLDPGLPHPSEWIPPPAARALLDPFLD
jgi:hypothetical protein